MAALRDRAGRGPLVVVGASGAGKSSMLRAGVVAALTPAAPDGRPPALLTPGETPLAALAAAGSDAPLLVVDQFEEVFGPAVDEDERAAFIRELCALATPVVIALRADFYGRALEYPELARAAQEAQVVVGPMDDTDLRSAVVEPARKAGVTIEDGLVEVLLADVHRPGSESGAAGLLPLLSHALLATWRRGEGVRMTVADYHAVGGIVGGVAQSAEEAFTQLPADRQELVRRIFLRLVHVAPDLADTRRRVERAELPGGARGRRGARPLRRAPAAHRRRARRRDHPRGAADRLAPPAELDRRRPRRAGRAPPAHRGRPGLARRRPRPGPAAARRPTRRGAGAHHAGDR